MTDVFGFGVMHAKHYTHEMGVGIMPSGMIPNYWETVDNFLLWLANYAADGYRGRFLVLIKKQQFPLRCSLGDGPVEQPRFHQTRI